MTRLTLRDEGIENGWVCTTGCRDGEQLDGFEVGGGCGFRRGFCIVPPCRELLIFVIEPCLLSSRIVHLDFMGCETLESGNLPRNPRWMHSIGAFGFRVEGAPGFSRNYSCAPIITDECIAKILC